GGMRRAEWFSDQAARRSPVRLSGRPAKRAGAFWRTATSLVGDDGSPSLPPRSLPCAKMRSVPTIGVIGFEPWRRVRLEGRQSPGSGAADQPLRHSIGDRGRIAAGFSALLPDAVE